MNTHKTFKIMLTALILFTASLSVTSTDAEAKAYKAKTVKVTSGIVSSISLLLALFSLKPLLSAHPASQKP